MVNAENIVNGWILQHRLQDIGRLGDFFPPTVETRRGLAPDPAATFCPRFLQTRFQFGELNR